MNYLTALLVISIVLFNPVMAQAKGGDEQDQIILLNDSAAAIEDSDPDLSKSLTKFADEKEIDWENKNANKDVLPTPVTDEQLRVSVNTTKYIKLSQDRIKILEEAAVAIKPTYPLIAQGLRKMAHDINRSIEIEK